MKTFVRIALCALTVIGSAALPAAACDHTPGSAAQARCLEGEASRLIAQSDRRVAEAGRRMKGLKQHDLRAFQAWLSRSQRDWRERTEHGCASFARSHPEDLTAGPACRAREAQRRNAEIDGYLSGVAIPRR